MIRLCLSLKGEEEGRIILGAFSMIDYYYYFDRKAKQLRIFKEDCFVRCKELLKKERVLEEHPEGATKRESRVQTYALVVLMVFVCAWVAMYVR